MNQGITVRYFAALKEKAGLAVEKIETQAKTASELYHELRERYDFTLDAKHLKVSINRQYQPLSQPIKDGDEVVFIPPVAGG